MISMRYIKNTDVDVYKRQPCEVENDVNCAGLAEHMSGASKGSKSALMLTIGTGIGGSMVIGGEVYHGCSGLSLIHIL